MKQQSLFWNKKGATLQSIAIAMLIAGGVVTGLGLMAIDMGQLYENPLNDTFVESFGILNSSIPEISELNTNVTGKLETGSGVVKGSLSEGRFDKVLTQAIKLVFGLPKLFLTLLTEIANRIGLPVWSVVLLTAWFGITIVFLMIRAFLRTGSVP